MDTLPPPPPHPLPALVTYELRDYRHQLEHALQALPPGAPARDLLQQRLREVLAEQQSRITPASEHAGPPPAQAATASPGRPARPR